MLEGLFRPKVMMINVVDPLKRQPLIDPQQFARSGFRHGGAERPGPFPLVMDGIDHLPRTGDRGIYLKQQFKGKLTEHEPYIDRFGQNMPAIRN